MGINSKKITKEYAQAVLKLKEELPINGFQMVADRCNTSIQMVSMVFNLDRYPREKIVKAAIEVIKEHREKERALAEEIQQVIDE